MYIYIYGAKSVAIRTCKSLEIMGDACTWVCSIKKYDNPCQLYGKNVYRIEEENRHYDCMALAVNGGILWNVRDEIVQYDIDKLILISTLMNDTFLNEAGKNYRVKAGFQIRNVKLTMHSSVR